jgi:hypothetical protein
LIFHGFGCAKSEQSGRQNIIKIEQSMDLPRYAMATVILKGWHLKYLHSDHNVAGIVTMIRNIKFDRGRLSWQAVELLSDDNFNNPYSWCYHFTVLAWNPAHIDLLVDHKDGDCDSHNPADVNFSFADNKGTTTALSSFPTILQNTIFQDKKTVTIAPRGFAFKWDYDGDVSDHNLLQIGYNYEYAIPMLTGWELNYDCREDHNVKEIGIWIDQWNYERDPATSLGRLHYTLSSYMADKDGNPDFVYAHKVTVLGLKPLAEKGSPISRLP